MNEHTMPLEQALEDTDRVEYFRGMTDAITKAVLDDGVDIRAYFPWSMYTQARTQITGYKS